MKTANAKIISFQAALILISFFSVTGISSCSKGLTLTPHLIIFTDSTVTDSTTFIDITLDNNRILRIEDGGFSPLSWVTLGNIQWFSGPDGQLFYHYR
jgi:hypothetical protein